MKRTLLAALLCLAPSLALAQGLPIKSGATSDLATVDLNKNLRTTTGSSTRPTYKATVATQATTAAILLSIESSAGTGFKLVKLCFGTSPATANAAITVTVRRTTTASSAGAALTAEGTGVTAISKMNPGDGNYGGIARLGGTPGTAGATLDQFAWTSGEVGAGAADPGSAPFCADYGEQGGITPTVAAGVTNGLSINISSHGAGGLAAGAISATIIAE